MNCLVLNLNFLLNVVKNDTQFLTLPKIVSAATALELSGQIYKFSAVKFHWGAMYHKLLQEAQLMLTTGSTRLAVNQGQQT